MLSTVKHLNIFNMHLKDFPERGRRRQKSSMPRKVSNFHARPKHLAYWARIIQYIIQIICMYV